MLNMYERFYFSIPITKHRICKRNKYKIVETTETIVINDGECQKVPKVVISSQNKGATETILNKEIINKEMFRYNICDVDYRHKSSLYKHLNCNNCMTKA